MPKVIYKMGGTEGQYDPKLTRLPVLYKYDGSRDNWKPGDPKVIGDSTNRTLEMVVAAVTRTNNEAGSRSNGRPDYS